MLHHDQNKMDYLKCLRPFNTLYLSWLLDIKRIEIADSVCRVNTFYGQFVFLKRKENTIKNMSVNTTR